MKMKKMMITTVSPIMMKSWSLCRKSKIENPNQREKGKGKGKPEDEIKGIQFVDSLSDLQLAKLEYLDYFFSFTMYSVVAL
mmetsp:Transcript_1794/g.2390  ORF Transcript_1794/g.2390 Transcript_1794/m.2390 type:complete len:81 (+) Transcript_1794:346-588(+)